MTKNITPANLSDVLALDPAPRAAHVGRTLANLKKRVDGDTSRTWYVVAPVVASLLEEVRPGKADRVEGMSYTWNSQSALATDMGCSGADVTTFKRLARAIELGVTEDSDLWRGLVSGRAVGMAEFSAWETFADADAYAAALHAYRTRGTTADPVAATPEASVEAATQGQQTDTVTPVAPVEADADTRAPQVASEAGVDPRKSPVDALHLITMEVNAGRMSKATRRAMVEAMRLLEEALDAAR